MRGDRGAHFVLEAVDFAEDGAFSKLDGGFGEVGFGLPKVGDALFGIGAVLGALLVDLVAEVVELGLRVAGGDPPAGCCRRAATKSPSLTAEPLGISLVRVMGPPWPQI